MKGEKDGTSDDKIFENIRQVLDSSGNDKLPPEERELLWQRIHESLLRKGGQVVRLTWLRAAAAAVLLVGAAIWFLD
ncbi:MAG TPA: hypothetical protein VD772_01235, partial [Anseongella sp.]|nr:hypothetical protein [Anseongella sp.]